MKLTHIGIFGVAVVLTAYGCSSGSGGPGPGGTGGSDTGGASTGGTSTGGTSTGGTSTGGTSTGGTSTGGDASGGDGGMGGNGSGGESTGGMAGEGNGEGGMGGDNGNGDPPSIEEACGAMCEHHAAVDCQDEGEGYDDEEACVDWCLDEHAFAADECDPELFFEWVSCGTAEDNLMCQTGGVYPGDCTDEWIAYDDTCE